MENKIIQLKLLKELKEYADLMSDYSGHSFLYRNICQKIIDIETDIDYIKYIRKIKLNGIK
jgi:uncharacterized protein with PhoU and TrkA domain